MSYRSIFMRDLRLMMSIGSGAAQAVVLYTVMAVTTLFILSPHITEEVVLNLVWVCGLSALQISARSLFEDDYRNGVLEQLFISDYLPEVVIFLRILAHWICVAVPISVISALLYLVSTVSTYSVLSLGLSLSYALFVVTCVSAVGNALVLGGGRGIIIAQILTFPTVMPVSVCFNLFSQNLTAVVHHNVAVLFTMCTFCLVPLSVFFTLGAIRLAVEQN